MDFGPCHVRRFLLLHKDFIVLSVVCSLSKNIDAVDLYFFDINNFISTKLPSFLFFSSCVRPGCVGRFRYHYPDFSLLGLFLLLLC